MNIAESEKILSLIQELPKKKLAEVIDFIEYIKIKEEIQVGWDYKEFKK